MVIIYILVMVMLAQSNASFVNDGLFATLRVLVKRPVSSLPWAAMRSLSNDWPCNKCRLLETGLAEGAMFSLTAFHSRVGSAADQEK